jgi:FtsP/CotA-like multicopper oxidase with cupredoxin domain
MKDKTFNTKPIKLALLLAGIGMAQASYAVDLVAIEGQWSPDGGITQIPMWGFAADTGQLCGSSPDWAVGPQLTDADLVAGGLTINLRNCLGEPVSIVIPGQPATSCNGGACAPSTTVDSLGRTRATSFTTEAAAGGLVTYVWNTVRGGSFLYQSGSQPGKQVQMGLYGALTTGTYPDTHEEVTLLYSEIDPDLHTTPAAATPLGYHPRHYLVNGSTSQSFPAAGDTNHPTVLRFLNAGLGTHVPTLNGGQYMSLVAEDGNPYPYAKQQYSVDLAAGKTIDALWLPDSAGDYTIYDRRGNGMVATLTMAAGAAQPIANDDSYPVDEDSVLNVAAIGVLSNDTDSSLAALTVPPASASLVSSTSGGSLTLNADGSFIYTPNPDFNGDDVFTYRANDGTLDSNLASVNITVVPVNDAPAAVNDAYDAVEGGTLNVAAPGLLNNDSDLDIGDTLTVTTTPVVATANGTLTLYADGSFDYSPAVPAPDTDSFTYEVCDDGAPVLCDTAVVDITIIAAVNTAPVAVEDTAEVLRNSPGDFINLTDNDSDADGNLKDGLGNVAAGQITVTTGTTTSRGGTVSIVTNGVNYTPKRNFRGTDTFSYTVTDLDGAVSNEVIVRVNVVRP